MGWMLSVATCHDSGRVQLDGPIDGLIGFFLFTLVIDKLPKEPQQQPPPPLPVTLLTHGNGSTRGAVGNPSPRWLPTHPSASVSSIPPLSLHLTTLPSEVYCLFGTTSASVFCSKKSEVVLNGWLSPAIFSEARSRLQRVETRSRPGAASHGFGGFAFQDCP